LYGLDVDVSGASKVTQKLWSEIKSLLLLTVFFLLGSGVIIYMVVNKMSKPIIELSRISKQVAGGDLTINEIEVKSKDEIGILSYNFNNMIQNLRSIIQTTRANSEEVSIYSEELTASAEQSSQANNQ